MISDRTKALVIALTKLLPAEKSLDEISLDDLQNAVAGLSSSDRADLLKHGAARPTARTDAMMAALPRAPEAFAQLPDADKDAVWAYLIYSLILPPGARTAEEMFGPTPPT